MTFVQRVPLFVLVLIAFNVVMVVAPDMLVPVIISDPIPVNSASATPEASPAVPTPEASPAVPTPEASPAVPTPEASPAVPTPEASPSVPTPEASPAVSTPEASPVAPASPPPLTPTNGTVAASANTTTTDISDRVNLSIKPLFQAMLPSGRLWYPTMNDLLLLFAVIILFIELVKSARAPAGTIVEHMMSMFVFCAFLVEFLVYKNAGTSTFLVVTALALIDVVAGFTLASRSSVKGKTL